jgi:hypothetical protein
MTREEHLAWCKERARVLLREWKLGEAVASMVIDLNEHPETAVADGSTLDDMALMAARSNDYTMVERYIEGFR